MTPVPIKWAKIHQDGKAPYKKRESDICYDIYCIADDSFKKHVYTIGEIEKLDKPEYHLYPGQSHTFRTGIKVATPPNYGFIAKDRSSMGIKDVPVRAGVIEGTYRGEWLIHLQNVSNKIVTIKAGDRICQVKLVEIIPATLEECDENDLPDSDRGEQGWGSSGR